LYFFLNSPLTFYVWQIENNLSKKSISGAKKAKEDLFWLVQWDIGQVIAAACDPIRSGGVSLLSP
jgi:hypothetical protein